MRSMQLVLRTPHAELSPQEREYLEKKIQHLEHYSEKIADESTKIHIDIIQTDLKTTDHKIRVQGTLHAPNAYLRAEVGGQTFQEAVDLFVEKLKMQIDRYKTKLHRRDATGNWIETSTLENAASTQEDFKDTSSKITRRKNYSDARPMHEEEACEQMGLLGHTFFVFYNIDRDCVSVCYKRKDGNFGIIEMSSSGGA